MLGTSKLVDFTTLIVAVTAGDSIISVIIKNDRDRFIQVK